MIQNSSSSEGSSGPQTSPTPLPPDIKELTNQVADSVSAETGRSKKKIYVIYSKKHHSVLHDPMTRKPVNAIDPRMLREAAKQFNGVVMTLQEALNILLRAKP